MFQIFSDFKEREILYIFQPFFLSADSSLWYALRNKK